MSSRPSSNSVQADLSALLRIGNIELRARSIIEGYRQGIHRSPKHGYSAEFAEYRNYSVGDDIRYLDWKVLAKRDKSYIKKFREDTNLRCHLLLDLSRSMNYGTLGYTKLESARTLLATLALYLYDQGEDIGLLLYDGRPKEYLPPRHNQGHLQSILSTLATPADGTEAALNASIETILSNSRMRGLMIVVTDALTPIKELQESLTNLAASGHDVTLLQVLDPTEIHFTFDKVINLEDLESGVVLPTDPDTAREGYLKKFEEHQNALITLCDQLNILHHTLPIDTPMEQALHNYLSDRAARGPIIQRRKRF